MGVKIDHKINTFSDHFQTILIKREPKNFKREKSYWILNCGLLQDKKYIQHIKKLWENWQTQQNDLDQFENGGRKGSNTLRLLLNFTLERIQQHNSRKSVA